MNEARKFLICILFSLPLVAHAGRATVSTRGISECGGATAEKLGDGKIKLTTNGGGKGWFSLGNGDRTISGTFIPAGGASQKMSGQNDHHVDRSEGNNGSIISGGGGVKAGEDCWGAIENLVNGANDPNSEPSEGGAVPTPGRDADGGGGASI